MHYPTNPVTPGTHRHGIKMHYPPTTNHIKNHWLWDKTAHPTTSPNKNPWASGKTALSHTTSHNKEPWLWDKTALSHTTNNHIKKPWTWDKTALSHKTSRPIPLCPGDFPVLTNKAITVQFLFERRPFDKLYMGSYCGSYTLRHNDRNGGR